MINRAGAALSMIVLACSSEPARDYDFTNQYMLLPVAFTAFGQTYEPDPTWCFPIESLELCMYTAGEIIRIGYTNHSSSADYHILWREGRYVDENGRPHRIEVYPPDLTVPERIRPGAHEWHAFVPVGKRYFKDDGGYFHTEWLVPWNEGTLTEEEAKRRVEKLFASKAVIRIELPVVLPDGRKSSAVATMNLVDMSEHDFLIRYGKAKHEASQRESSDNASPDSRSQ